MVALADAEPVNAAVVRYLNRLSDHLFVLARRLNAASGGDVLVDAGPEPITRWMVPVHDPHRPVSQG